jgi:hypothetical protein
MKRISLIAIERIVTDYQLFPVDGRADAGNAGVDAYIVLIGYNNFLVKP